MLNTFLINLKKSLNNILFENEMLLLIEKDNKTIINKVNVIINKNMLYILNKNSLLYKINLQNLIIFCQNNFVNIKNFNFIIYSFEIKIFKFFKDIISKKAISLQNIQNDFEFINKIGQGSNSKIYKVKDKKNDVIYACKKMNILKNKSFDNGYDEVNILNNLNCSNILNPIKIFFNNSKLFLITNLYYNINDFDEMRNYNNYPILCLKVLKGLVNALYELKKQQIIHRDISINNILFKRISENISELDVLISDFGACKKVSKDLKYIKRNGTPNFIDPIILNNCRLELDNNLRKEIYSIDVFSLGCIFYYLITKKFVQLKKNFKISNRKEVKESLIKYKLNKNVKNEIWNLIDRMLTKNLYNRIKIDELINHPIFETMYTI